MLRLALSVLAFASLPLAHPPRGPSVNPPATLSLFVGEMMHLVPQGSLAYQPRETATPVLDDAETRLYVGTSDGVVRCQFRGQRERGLGEVDLRALGRRALARPGESWSWHARGSILAAPLLQGETLYVAAAGGFLTALNRITGHKRWESDVHEELTTTPTFEDGRLFLMSSEETATAVGAEDGKILWKFHRDRPGGFTIRGNARPRVAHGLVFVGFADGTVAALRPEDGVSKWVRNVSGTGDYLDVDAIEAPPEDSRIYVASAKAGVLALEAETGETAWIVPLTNANHVLVDGARVYASGQSLFLALDRKTGRELWRFRLGRDRYATAASVSSGLVVFAEDRGPLYAVDAERGMGRALFDPGSGFSGGPLTRGGAAFIVSNGGALFTLGLLP